MARIKGTLNKQPVAMKHLAQRYTEDALRQIVNIMTRSKVESNRLLAAQQILDRGFGKPSQAVVGDPEQPQYSKIEVSWKK